MFFRSALSGAEGHLWPLCHLPDYLSFSFEIVEVFFLRLDIILAAFGGTGEGGANLPVVKWKQADVLTAAG